jgi:hypothetical protein
MGHIVQKARTPPTHGGSVTSRLCAVSKSASVAQGPPLDRLIGYYYLLLLPVRRHKVFRLRILVLILRVFAVHNHDQETWDENKRVDCAFVDL